MIVYIMTGANETGKDTFVNAFKIQWRKVSSGNIFNMSTIKPFKDILDSMPFKHYFNNDIDGKNETYRSLLVALKNDIDEHYHKSHGAYFSNMYIVDSVDDIHRNSPNGIFFVDCREPEKIKDLKERLAMRGHSVYTIKTIRSAAVLASNESDKAAAEFNECDYVIDNDNDVKTNVIDFIRNEAFPKFLEITYVG